tara:strand:+ start:4148 stop:4660 length:513 start_codon:yes stop_codon:yes gene_type:complete
MTFIEVFINQIIKSLYDLGCKKETQPSLYHSYFCFFDLSFINKIAHFICLSYYLNNQEKALEQKILQLENKYFKKDNPYYYYIISFITQLKKYKNNNDSIDNLTALKLYFNELINKNDIMFIHFKNINTKYTQEKSLELKSEHILVNNIFKFFKFLKKDIQRQINLITQK